MKKEINPVEDTLFSASHPHLYKRTNVRSVWQSSFIALGGVTFFTISSVMEKNDSSLNMVFLIVGIALLIFAIYRFFCKSSEVVYRPTESVVRSGSLFVDSAELQRINQLVKKEDFTKLSSISCKDGGNGRIDYLVSKDGRFVAIQLFQFVPYTFEPISEKSYYTDDVAIAIARSIGV